MTTIHPPPAPFLLPQAGAFAAPVRFTATEIDPQLHVCHCSMCRRHAGAPTMSVSVGGVTFEGEENILRYKSSDYAERGTCKKCGGHLFYRLTGPDHYIMSTGPFDDQSQFTMGGEIFIDNKPAALCLRRGSYARDRARISEADRRDLESEQVRVRILQPAQCPLQNLRRDGAEGDPIAAEAEYGIAVGVARDRADQRQAGWACTEAAAPRVSRVGSTLGISLASLRSIAATFSGSRRLRVASSANSSSSPPTMIRPAASVRA